MEVVIFIALIAGLTFGSIVKDETDCKKQKCKDKIEIVETEK